MKEQIGDKVRLEHILDSTRLILKFVKGANLDEFLSNEMMFSACARHLEIIGEASARLTMETKSKHPEIAWSSMIGMRNILIHDYFGVSQTIIWKTIEEDLPMLKSQIETILLQHD